MKAGMTVVVGWGRTLFNTLPFITGATLDDFRVVSLLGGIAAARRFNPAEFAWQFAELFQGEGFLIPAPAVVDSAETKHALLERCGLSAIFEMADKLDMALLSCGRHQLADHQLPDGLPLGSRPPLSRRGGGNWRRLV
jgi:deoxyribonucleoside regulator